MFSTEEKKKILKEYGKDEKDTGSPEAQVAILTFRIKYLTEHFKIHKQDYNSRLGLMKLIGRRRNLLRYLKGKDVNRYRELIAKLGLRK